MRLSADFATPRALLLQDVIARTEPSSGPRSHRRRRTGDRRSREADQPAVELFGKRPDGGIERHAPAGRKRRGGPGVGGARKRAAADLLALTPELTPPPGPKLVIAPGTGLGMAAAWYRSTQRARWIAVPSEGGHAHVAPTAVLSKTERAALWRTDGMCSSWEDLVSGIGLPRLYRALGGEERPRRGHYSASEGRPRRPPSQR